MLRKAVLAFGVLLLLGSAWAFLSGLELGAVLGLLIFGLVLTLGVIYDRYRYKPIRDQKPGGDWRDTGERFMDTETGKRVAVYMEPATGERIYVFD